MRKEELLLTKLKEYGSSDFYPMHMPGHKRNRKNTFLEDFSDPFEVDITEIDGFDNLHHPEEILKESMEWAASVYHSEKTYYLVNGSSGGILSAISAATHSGGRILVSRNCHKSVYHGIILRNLQVGYIYPQIIREMGIQGEVLAEDVDKALQNHPDMQAVLIVSPTYDGVVSDVAAIAKVVHKYGVPLIVDEAHGAHFSFGGDEFPRSAVDCGADIVIQSLHKTLPSLTQTAVLHVQGNLVDLEKLEHYLQIYQTSSPSYVFMASIESCIFEMEQNGYSSLCSMKHKIHEIRARFRELKALRVLEKQTEGMFDLDPAKIVISCRHCWTSDGMIAVNGGMLAEFLRDCYHIEMEMSSVDYVTAIVSCFDTAEGLDRLCNAVLEIDKELIRLDDEMVPNMYSGWEHAKIRMNMADAMEFPYEKMSVVHCKDRISAEFIYLYPPGIPIVAPGEIITEEMIANVMNYKDMGFSIQGMVDKTAEFLRVISEE